MTKTELFAEYGSYHADKRNRACHAVGIPLIVLGVLGLFSSIKLGPIDLAIPVAIVVLAYYASLTVRGALISLVAFAVLYVIAARLSWQLDVAAFVVGWVFQLIGHRFEGNKPKFLENLTYLSIGPLYFFDHVFERTVGR